MSLTEALLAHGNGDEAQVHERIEHAVYRAEPQSVLRPFTERRDELADLLIRHAVWGTTHESFIAARMARHAKATRTSGPVPTGPSPTASVKSWPTCAQ